MTVSVKLYKRSKSSSLGIFVVQIRAQRHELLAVCSCWVLGDCQAMSDQRAAAVTLVRIQRQSKSPRSRSFTVSDCLLHQTTSLHIMLCASKLGPR